MIFYFAYRQFCLTRSGKHSYQLGNQFSTITYPYTCPDTYSSNHRLYRISEFQYLYKHHAGYKTYPDMDGGLHVGQISSVTLVPHSHMVLIAYKAQPFLAQMSPKGNQQSSYIQYLPSRHHNQKIAWYQIAQHLV